MRDAAVGFQCPECVSEGKRETRTGRTTFGGLRPSNAGLTSFTLIGINLAVWLAIVASGGNSSRLLNWLALVPKGRCVVDGRSDLYYPNIHSEAVCAGRGDWIPGVADGAYWQLLTSAFAHVEIWHIGFNMLALYVLGPQLEVVIGRARFLALYLLSALAGSALVMWATPVSQSTVGASTAIFGLMGALLIVAFKLRINPQQILMWIAINFVFTVVFSGISWQGHVGGFVGGLAAAAAIVYAPRGPRRTTYQVTGLGAVGVLTVVAIIARIATLT
jgi:membrane associated rhomboid family serine protease